MKKILGLIIMLACLVSCNQKENTKITFIGRIVSIREHAVFHNELVIETDNGKVFSVLSKDEATDEYLYKNKLHIKIYVSYDKEDDYYINYGIKRIK